MDVIQVRCPFGIANLGIPIEFVDKASLFKAVKEYTKDQNIQEILASFESKPLDEQFVITGVNPFYETADVTLSTELYQKLQSSCVIAVLTASYLCDMEPTIDTPLWNVSAVRSEFLTVNIQAHIADFIYEENEPQVEVGVVNAASADSECNCECNDDCKCTGECSCSDEEE